MKKILVAALTALMLLGLALPASAAIQATSVEIRGSVYNDSAGENTTAWDALNFAGFWYDLGGNLKSETMQVNATAIGGTDRSIDDSQLNYTASRVLKKYKVYDKKTKYVENGLDVNGSISTLNGTHYAVLGWQAEKYIPLKGKAKKIVKQVLEQAAVDKQTLTVGQTWDMGDGWTLMAQSIDARATPRQAWLVLSKDGVKKDDKVVNAEGVYTYQEKSIAGESDVPLFVTYVDSIFAGATTDMVQLKYTWLVSTSVTEIKVGDKFGNMEVTGAGDNYITLKNKDKVIDLSKDSTQLIMGNLNFKVADSDTLRFYPMVEYVIPTVVPVVTPTPVVGVTPTPTVTPVNVTPTPTVTPVVTPLVETPTPAVTPTPGVTPPGFEAVFAIAGLLAVAYLVLRRRK